MKRHLVAFHDPNGFVDRTANVPRRRSEPLASNLLAEKRQQPVCRALDLLRVIVRRRLHEQRQLATAA